ncbi:MAG: FIST N-terminal domain-containing protein [Thiobacillus sp.]|nr:FIST N-terminal domain-containing protein [Thiobacillus sp.]
MQNQSTQFAQGHTALTDSTAAGEALGDLVKQSLGETRPDVVIVFASAIYAYDALLKAIDATCHPDLIVGCSSAGEFAGRQSGMQSASILAIHSTDMHFHAAVGTGLATDPRQAAQTCVADLVGMQRVEYPHRTALVLTDALAGYVDELINHINVESGGSYQLFGGGAGDDARFSATHIFYGTSALRDAVVMLEILSRRPIGIGAAHGWAPRGDRMRVTHAEGTRVYGLNALPLNEVFADHARATGQNFDPADPMPFFLNNVVGIEESDGYKLRVPLALHDDGSVSFAAEIPTGAIVCVMEASTGSTCDAGSVAAHAAKSGLAGAGIAAALVFDCAATRLRLGRAFDDELGAVEQTLGTSNYVGCNTYGQIVRVHGQFSGFHNCTAVVCAFPD